MIEPVVEDLLPAHSFAFRGMAQKPAGQDDDIDYHALISFARVPNNDAGLKSDVGALRAELRSISQAIPAFAIWQIDTLERCFHRYCNILQLASRDLRFRRNCVSLMASAERISAGLDLVRNTNQWTIFNRAAFELRQDCEQLVELLAFGE